MWEYGLDRGGQDRDRWRKIGSALLIHRVSKNAGNFLASCKNCLLLMKHSAPWGN